MCGTLSLYFVDEMGISFGYEGFGRRALAVFCERPFTNCSR
jgi:hypothetical protein